LLGKVPRSLSQHMRVPPLTKAAAKPASPNLAEVADRLGKYDAFFGKATASI
jgi:hypothetical protein